ncbi:BTAD domain-containing putative transcriptional regulator [Streptomyces sp. NBC_00388]|uniref:BTAD domain-containing putative transcriptional regulator n=1 Tax=Streptomyces sp. NBC_00388 TaxID=2975735 RepID=UPI002E2072B1
MNISSGGKHVALGPPRQRALLAVLLINVGRVVPLASIIQAVWGQNPPRRVTGTLQAYVSRLRKVLRHHDKSVRLTHHLHGYLLEADARLVDAVVFEARAKDCRKLLEGGDAQAARSAAWSVLELWKGKPLEELCDYEFAVMEADRLEQIRLRVLDVWAQACLQLGAYEEVTIQLGEELRRDPGLERLGGQLMLAQYHSGQPAEALHTYERIRISVAKDLGADLSRELQALHGKILRQELADPAVPGPSSPAAPASRTAPPSGPAAPEDRSEISPPGAAAARPAPLPGRWLAGRQAEVEQLRGLLEDARRGRGHLLLVMGEQGIGKTELLREMAQQVSPEVRVVRSSCSAIPSSPIYWIWEQAVQQVGDATAHSPDPQPQTDWTPAQHFAHQMRTCQALLTAAEHGPLVVLLEDLHFADPRVLDLLHLLTRQITHAQVVVLASMRDHALAGDRSLRRAVGRILQESNTTAVRLKGLTDAQSRDLITAVRGTAPPQDEVRRLQEATGGNPFLLHSLLATRTTARPEGQPVPFEVREVLYERLSQCSADARDVLTLCAVIGTRVWRPLLAGPLSSRGLPPDLVDEVLRTGLLRPDAADESHLSFTHGLVRDFLLEGAQPLTRARWHQEVAAVLVKRYQPGDDTAEIRHHCLQAARILGADEGVRPLLVLADQAQGRFFHHEAQRHLEDVASVIAALPGDERTSAVELCLHKRMMWLYALLEGYGSPRVKRAFGQARQLERSLDNTKPTELLHTRAIVAIAEGQYTTAAETASLLYELAEHGGGQEARTAACYADGVTLHVRGRLDEALATLGQGVGIIDRLLDASGGRKRMDNGLLHDQRIDYRAYLALTHWLNGDQSQATQYRSEILQLTQSDRYDRPWDRAFARYVDALLAMAEGDVQGAWTAGRAGVDLTTRCQLVYWHDMLAVPLGWAEVRQGMHESGLARIRGALQAAAGHRTLLRRTLHLGLLADALRHAGREDEARQTIALAAREIGERGEYVYLRPQWPFASLLHEHGVDETAAGVMPGRRVQ